MGAANVQVILSSGSVSVDFTITLPTSVSASARTALTSAIRGHLTTELVDALSAVPGINAVISGSMSISRLVCDDDAGGAGPATEPHNGTKKGKSCHDTKEGESCYTAVMWAMEHGIVVHPEWYPGLHVGSSFAEFQAHMDNIGHGGCEDPCDICETSKSGKQCYAAVTWAMEHGITLHPEWPIYSGLDAGSSFVDFQA